MHLVGQCAYLEGEDETDKLWLVLVKNVAVVHILRPLIHELVKVLIVCNFVNTLIIEAKDNAHATVV